MHISCLNQSVAETEFEPIYQEMNRRGSILFVHPADVANSRAVGRRPVFAM
jgi:hypothetical protein